MNAVRCSIFGMAAAAAVSLSGVVAGSVSGQMTHTGAEALSTGPSDTPDRAVGEVRGPGILLPGDVVATGEPPLPASVVVKKDHTVVRQKPTARVRRRGVVMAGARLPVLERATGEGCSGAWYRIHTDGWICSREVAESRDAPGAKHYPLLSGDALTPWPYGFVREPALAYRLAGGQLVEVRELQKGFGFSIAGHVRVYGASYFKTAENTLIPRAAAGMTSRVSRFEGMRIVDGKPWPVGFIRRRTTHVYAAPAQNKQNRVARAERYTPFEALESAGQGARRFIRFDEGAWLRSGDVRVARPVAPPEGISTGERWLDVDTVTQMMTAYEGAVPVYTTLISSGRQGSKTVKGAYRIWAKVAAIAMDNTDDEPDAPVVPDSTDTDTLSTEVVETAVSEQAQHLYSLRDVPWTQFFFESYALHGVYWHDGFGDRKSHGCVNLSPRDAKWFYEWTAPKVPAGWWAVHATDSDPGTLVQVR